VIESDPVVVFGAGRRPETATHVQLPAWEGPLGLLLAVIEARQLDVMTVPLGALAQAYLDALAGLAEDRLGNVSTFVTVASQLILIKSRGLLPRRVADPAVPLDEAPDPEAELRARLILYRAYRDAGAGLQDRADTAVRLFRREPAVASASALANARPGPGRPLDRRRLPAALASLAKIVPLPEPPPEIVPRTITIGERAQIIRDALRGADVVVLQDLLNGVRDRVVVAVTFLAMLELMKRREIVVEQVEPWGPIRARGTTAEERATAGLEVDEQTPIDESLASFA